MCVSHLQFLKKGQIMVAKMRYKVTDNNKTVKVAYSALVAFNRSFHFFILLYMNHLHRCRAPVLFVEDALGSLCALGKKT